MISKRIGTEAFQTILFKLMSLGKQNKLDEGISTKKFLKIIRNNTGEDLRGFAARWINGKGCPNLSCGFFFNSKKNIVEFALKQNKSPAGRISGTLTIRLNELVGPFDHTINFDDELQYFTLSCYSRPPKSNRNKKEDKENKNVELDNSTNYTKFEKKLIYY